jgi:hypothetical protein
VDPLAAKYRELSPYVFCHGDPINRIDIDGKQDPARAHYVREFVKRPELQKQLAKDLALSANRTIRYESSIAGYGGNVLSLVGVATGQLPVVVTGIEISTGASLVHAGTGIVDAVATGDKKELALSVAEGLTSAAASAGAYGISRLGPATLETTAKPVVDAVLDWAGSLFNHLVSSVANQPAHQIAEDKKTDTDVPKEDNMNHEENTAQQALKENN